MITNESMISSNDDFMMKIKKISPIFFNDFYHKSLPLSCQYGS